MVRVALAMAVAATLVFPASGAGLRAAGVGPQNQRLEFEGGVDQAEHVEDPLERTASNRDF